MSKAPSDATQLRTLKSEFNRLKLEFNQMTTERNAYRTRAGKAEQEAAEWRVRFDDLLRRDKPAPWFGPK